MIRVITNQPLNDLFANKEASTWIIKWGPELWEYIVDFKRRNAIKSQVVRHGYPWVPTDQDLGRPRQVGPAYQKTRRPVGGPNWPSWPPTRPPDDLLEDSPDNLVQHNLKTWRTRQDLGGFRPKADR
jgi:hypothetical protein